MKVSISKGIMTIEIPVNDPPTVSKSGITKLVASTHGTAPTTCEVDGHVISINLNATIPNR